MSNRRACISNVSRVKPDMGDGLVSKKKKKNTPIWRGEASPLERMESSNILTNNASSSTSKTLPSANLRSSQATDIYKPCPPSEYQHTVMNLAGSNGIIHSNEKNFNRKRKSPGTKISVDNVTRVKIPIPIPVPISNPHKYTPISIPTQNRPIHPENTFDMIVQGEKQLLDEAFHELYGKAEQNSIIVKNTPATTNKNYCYQTNASPINVIDEGSEILNLASKTIQNFKKKSDTTMKSKFYIEELAWKLHNPPTPHCCGPHTFKQIYDEEVYSKKTDTHKKQKTSKSINTNVESPSKCEALPSLPLSPIVDASNDKKSNHYKKEAIQSIKPLSPSTPLPAKSKFPNTPYCQWSFDPSSRVLHADFTPRFISQNVIITPQDEEFLYLMMERDDITVVSSGLCQNMNPRLWNKTYLSSSVGNDVYHRFRSFQRVLKHKNKLMNRSGSQNGKTTVTKKKVKETSETKKVQSNVEQVEYAEHGTNIFYEENDLWFKLRMKDYFRYLSQREQVLENISQRRIKAGLDPVNPQNEEEDKFYRREDEEIFKYEDLTNKENDKERYTSINCLEKVLYMIDYDLGKYLPKVKEDFVESFPLKGILPGGAKCMMNAVNLEARPFMGPNLYLTPPASFTQFHQDGHGTVDSGHMCLSGYNEVVMLRRLTEAHKRHALFLLNGGKLNKAFDFKWNSYDALYGRPHDDGYVDRPDWPTVQSIRKCKSMNYYPSVFILKPGQLVHINKGRLHAFRKLSPTTLPKSDCHHALRSKLMIAEKLGYEEQICMSVAWDWMYKGITDYGINKEISSILECAHLNRQQLKQTLAIPETSVIKMAKELVAQYEYLTDHSKEKIANKSMISSKIKQSTIYSNARLHRETMAGLRGILASLRYVVSCHQSALSAKQCDVQNITIASIPNTWENPDLSPLDPYGSSDFFCKLCYKELSNVYLHCDGCEDILKKDFNICESCHSEHRYKLYVQMHPMDDSDDCAINHTGHHSGLSPAMKCSCKKKTICNRCNYCSGCSCKCHHSFTLHHRFMSTSEEKEILDKVEKIVGSPEWRIEVTNERLNSLKNPESKHTDSKLMEAKPNENSKMNEHEYDTRKSIKLEGVVNVGKLSSNLNDETNAMSDGVDTKEIEQSNLAQSTDEKIKSACDPNIILDSSFYDMLAKSKPFNSEPAIKKRALIEGCDIEELRKKFKRFLDAKLIRSSEFHDVIPKGFDKNNMLHLYRNFMDTTELFDLKRTKLISFSSRELEILIDHVAKRKEVDSMVHFELIPYRAKRALQMVVKDLIKLDVTKNKDLIRHVDAVVKCITEWNNLATSTIDHKSTSKNKFNAMDRSVEKMNLEEENQNNSIPTKKKMECNDNTKIVNETSVQNSIEDSGINICNHIQGADDWQKQIKMGDVIVKDYDVACEQWNNEQTKIMKIAEEIIDKMKDVPYPHGMEEQRRDEACQIMGAHGSDICKLTNADNVEMDLVANHHGWDKEFMYTQIDCFDQRIHAMFSNTKPKCNGAFRCTEKIVSTVKNLSVDGLQTFIIRSSSPCLLSSLSTEYLSNLIPSFDRKHVFHLYRNFHDEKLIGGNYLGAVHFCRREIEILSYVLAKNEDLSHFKYLIPYRHEKDLKEALQQIVNEKLLDDAMYKTNIEISMSALFQWEKENVMAVT